MKTKTTLLIAIALLLSCKPKDKYEYNYVNETTYNKDTTMRNNEKFNWQLFNSKPKERLNFNQDTGDMYIYMAASGFQLSESKSYADSYFTYDKIYYASTSGIWKEGESFTRGGWNSGIWKYYDENGVLSHTIDYDRPFTFGIDKVLEFMEKEGWALDKGYKSMGVSLEVERYLFEGYPYWKISKGRPDVSEIVLDGKNGKVVSRREYIKEH